MNPRLTLLIASLLLTACAEPQTLFKPVTVDVPVAVPCPAKLPPKPASPLSLTSAASLFDKTKAVLAAFDLQKAYDAQLEAALHACE